MLTPPRGDWRRRPGIVLAAGIALIAAIGGLDLATGVELSFSVFYLAPVGVVAWVAGRGAGVALSLLGAAVWMLADRAGGHSYTAAWIPFWNAGVRLAFFVIVTDLLARLRDALDRQQQFATTDYLTGAANLRAILAAADAELQRLRRYGRPLTIAYTDLDNFKEVNDRDGHAAGDALLRLVARTIRANVRAVDTLARLGGDEFAVLLPETDADAARAVFDKVHRLLTIEAREWGYPVTFSTGVVTCFRAPSSVDELMRLPDKLMYRVKQSAKNAVRYETFGAERPDARDERYPESVPDRARRPPAPDA